MAIPPRLSDVRRLADVRARWCVSIYGDAVSWLAGRHPGEAAEAQIRATLDGLRIGGARDDLLDAMRDRLRRLSESSRSAPAYDSRIRSVAIFATDDRDEMFLLTSEPRPWVGVADRFTVGPLLEAALALVPPVHVLTISESRVRLVDVSALPPMTVDVADAPRNLEDAIALDLTGDRNTLAHLRTSEDPKVRLLEYSRVVNRAVEPVLRRSGAVLVIAAAEPLASIYRSVNTHEPVASSTLTGNHDHDAAQELATRAAPLIETHRREVLESQLARFRELPDRDLVLVDFGEVSAAAREGAVDTLFVDTDQRIPVEGEAFDGRTTIDMVDEIIRWALAKDSAVIPVRQIDLRTPGPVAAILRYPRAHAPGRP